jgi:hypothetical protein
MRKTLTSSSTYEPHKLLIDLVGNIEIWASDTVFVIKGSSCRSSVIRGLVSWELRGDAKDRKVPWYQRLLLRCDYGGMTGC